MKPMCHETTAVILIPALEKFVRESRRAHAWMFVCGVIAGACCAGMLAMWCRAKF